MRRYNTNWPNSNNSSSRMFDVNKRDSSARSCVRFIRPYQALMPQPRPQKPWNFLVKKGWILENEYWCYRHWLKMIYGFVFCLQVPLICSEIRMKLNNLKACGKQPRTSGENAMTISWALWQTSFPHFDVFPPTPTPPPPYLNILATPLLRISFGR